MGGGGEILRRFRYLSLFRLATLHQRSRVDGAQDADAVVRGKSVRTAG